MLAITWQIDLTTRGITVHFCVLAAFLGCSRSVDQGIDDAHLSLPVIPYTASITLNNVRSIKLEWPSGSVPTVAKAVRVDSSGHFLWMEPRPPLYVFDSKGKFLRTLGSSGEGPGEFGATDAMGIDMEGFIRVLDGDRLRISVFSPDYEFIESYPIETDRTFHLAINSYGHTAFLRKAWWAGFEPALAIFDAKGHKIAEAGEIPIWAKVQANVLPAGGIGIDAEDNVYYTFVTSHKIWKTDRNGSLLAVLDSQPGAYYKAPDHDALAAMDDDRIDQASIERIRYIESVSRTSGLFVIPERDLVFQEIVTESHPTTENNETYSVRFDLEVWSTAGFKIATAVKSRPQIKFADARYLYYVFHPSHDEQNPVIALYEYTIDRNEGDPDASTAPS